MWVRSLSREDPLEEGVATHSSILVWRIPMDRGSWWVTVHGAAKSSAQSCPTLCDPMDCSMPGLPVRSLLKFMSIESVMPSNHLILCCPLLLLPSIFPSIRVFSNESVLYMRWPKYWSCSFSIGPSNEPPGLISFRMDWLDLLAVQGTLKSLLKSINSSVLSFLYSPTLTSIHDLDMTKELDTIKVT